MPAIEPLNELGGRKKARLGRTRRAIVAARSSSFCVVSSTKAAMAFEFAKRAHGKQEEIDRIGHQSGSG